MDANTGNRYQIRIALNTSLPLSGEGEEWLMDGPTGEVIARLWNGNFVCAEAARPGLTDEPTLLLPQEAA